MIYLLQAIPAIPTPWWQNPIVLSGAVGTILGASISLFGTFIQKWFDARTQARERIFKLRQELLLKAIEEFSVAKRFAADLPDSDLGDAPSILQGLTTVSSQLELVMRPKNLAPVFESVSALNLWMVDSLPLIGEIQGLVSSAKQQNYFFDETQVRIKSIIDRMHQENLNATLTPPVADTLNKAFERQQELATEFANKRDELNAKAIVLKRKYLEDFFGWTTQTGVLESRAMVAIRSELNIPTGRRFQISLLDVRNQGIAALREAFERALPSNMRPMKDKSSEEGNRCAEFNDQSHP